MTFSFLDKSDVDKIVAFNTDNFSDGWSKQMLVSAFDSGRFYCLATMEQGVCVALLTFSVAMDQADVEGIVTRVDKRRCGIAEKLFFKAQERLLELGVKKLFLEVRQSNIPAKNLYNKCGFSEISVRKNYYSDGENAIVMVKEL